MPRTYSRNACSTCKLRKKKCDEEQPACSSCTRLKLKCSYDQISATLRRSHRGAVDLGRFELAKTLRLDQTLQARTPRETTELGAMSRAPSSVLAFYGPLCGEEYRDLRLIWQMVFRDELIHDATVACFSVVFGRTPCHGQISYASYCSTLQLVRQRVAHQRTEGTDLLALQIAVFFLGLMDSVGPKAPLDLHLHWRGLAQLLAHTYPDSMRRLSPLQKNVFLLVLEAAAYHLSCQMLFAEDAESLRRLWCDTRIFEMLKETNPEGPEQITRSPLLCGCGGYIIFELVVQLTYLSRNGGSDDTAKLRLDDIESTLQQLKISQAARSLLYRNQKHPALEISRMFLGALYVCLTALRDESDEQSRTIDRSALEIFVAFSSIRLMDINHAPTVWPVQILACAIRLECEFVRFKYELAELKLRLDPGHTRRLEAVVDEVECVRLATKTTTDQYELNIPPALSLLRKRDGILS